MTPALFLALVLLAGSTQNGFYPGMSWPDINIENIIASLPEIIARLRELIAEILPNLPGIIDSIDISNLPEIIANLPEIIANLPDIIANLPEINWPEVIANLPGNLPDIVGSIIEVITNLEIDWPAIIDLLPEINLPDIIANLPEIIDNLPDIIANLPEILEQLPEIIGNLPIDWPAIIEQLPEIERDPGVEASIEQFPSLVQIESRLSTLWVQVCVGVIVSNTYVVSAAHCVAGRLAFDDRIAVRAGSSTRGRGGDILPIAYSLAHPTFGTQGREGNIAVVRTAGYFVYGPRIQRAPIVSQGSYMPAGLNLQHASWGSTAQGRLISNRQLHTADMVVVSLESCREKYSEGLIDRYIGDNNFCFGRPGSLGRRPDLRDSGAGLFYSNALVGIQSHGRYVSNGSYPVVAISIGAYSNWIAATAT